jgi:tripartite-type tricarboxylate transporter receptor subunit TctC
MVIVLKRLLLIGLLSMLLLAFVGNLESMALDYPTQPINIIVPYSAGGGNDRVARVLASFGQEYFGTGIQVIDMPGASGTTGGQFAAQSKPDGYTLLINTDIGLTTPPMITDLPYDVFDFTGIVSIASNDYVWVVKTDAPWQSFSELIEYARENPGKISYGTTGAGGAVHVALAAFLIQEGIEMIHVPFEGAAPALAAVAGGHIDMVGPALSSVLPVVAAGQVRPLVTSGLLRRKDLPDTPTIIEEGYDYSFSSHRVIVAPKGTPQKIIDFLEEKFLEVFKDKAFLVLIQRVGQPLEDGKLVGTMGSAEITETLHTTLYERLKSVVETLKK